MVSAENGAGDPAGGAARWRDEQGLATARAHLQAIPRTGDAAGPGAAGTVPGPLAGLFAASPSRGAEGKAGSRDESRDARALAERAARTHHGWQQQLLQVMNECLPALMGQGTPAPHAVEVTFVHSPELSDGDIQRYTVADISLAAPDRVLSAALQQCLDHPEGMMVEVALPWSDELPAMFRENFSLFLPAETGESAALDGRK